MIREFADGEPHSGPVKVGVIETNATWRKGAEGYFTVRLPMSELSVEEQDALNHYKASSQPLPIKFPCDARSVASVVIGFEREADAYMLHIARAYERKKVPK